jgi:4-amino-4-deoxy-L-arabinose transferase-like glycosyltransferase
MRTPGYPFFVASVYRLFGVNHFYVILIQILISGCTIIMTYLIARKIFGVNAALASIFLLILDFSSLYSSQKIFTETLFTFTLVIAVTAGLKIEWSDKKKRWAILFGLMLAISTLIRPAAYFLIFPVIIGFAIAKWSSWKWKKMVVILLLIMIPWFILIGGWKLRNYYHFGTFEFSSVMSHTMLTRRAPEVLTWRDGISRQEASLKLQSSLPNIEELSIDERNKLSKQKAMSVIVNNPFIYLKVLTHGIARMMFVPGEGEVVTYLTYKGGELEKDGPAGDLLRLSFNDYMRKWLLKSDVFLWWSCAFIYIITFYICFAHGYWRTVVTERNNSIVHYFILGVIIYLIITVAGGWANSRYRVPIMPLIAIYSGRGLWAFIQCFRPGKRLVESI